jgi:hypothetical protein
MTFSILVQPENGQFAAQLVGEHDLRIVRPTRDEALNAMQDELRRRVEAGELVSVTLANAGVIAAAGRLADDPTLQEICDDIYTLRDRERDELPE